MSFLNALASDGLTVGLRFYNAKMNAAKAPGNASGTASCESAENSVTATEEKERPSLRSVSKPSNISPVDEAAGRVEAKALLAEKGALGLIQAAPQPEPAPNGTSGSEAEVEEQAANALYGALPGNEALAEDIEEGTGGGIAEDEESGNAAQGPGKDLNEEEQRQVQEMKDRDREVRTHEQAHVSAAAGLAGTPVYDYQTGPDGKRYAVGGHVDIQRGGSSDPEKALQEAETVKRAALAPASPSSTDRAVASKAAADINQLKSEKTAERGRADESEEAEGPDSLKSDSPSGKQSHETSRLGYGGAAPVFNGSSLNAKALGAYSTAKFGLAAQAAPLRASA